MGTGRVLTGVGLAAVLAAIVVALLANTSNPPSGQSASPGLRVPDALAGTPLSAAVRGAAAVEEVSRLHGRRGEGSDAGAAPPLRPVRSRRALAGGAAGSGPPGARGTAHRLSVGSRAMDETTRGGVRGAFRTLRLWVAGLPPLRLRVPIGGIVTGVAVAAYRRGV